MTSHNQPLDPDLLMSHAAALRGLARHLVADEHAAEDVVQETLALALERPPRETAGLAAWLRVALRHVAFKRTRAERGRSAREKAAAQPEELPATVTLVEHRALLEGVAGALLGLHEPYQTALFLRYFEDLPPRAISARLGVNEATIKSRLHRGLALLRERLDERHDGGRAAWAGIALAWSGDTAKKGVLGALGGLLVGKNIAVVAVGAGLVGLLVWLGGDGPLQDPGPVSGFENVSAALDSEREPLDPPPEETELPPVKPPTPSGGSSGGTDRDALDAEGDAQTRPTADRVARELPPLPPEIIETPPLAVLPEQLVRTYTFTTNLTLDEMKVGNDGSSAPVPEVEDSEVSIKLARSFEFVDVSGSQAAPYELLRTYSKIESKISSAAAEEAFAGAPDLNITGTSELQGAAVGFLSNPEEAERVLEDGTREPVAGLERDLSAAAIYKEPAVGAHLRLRGDDIAALLSPGGDLRVKYDEGGYAGDSFLDPWGPATEGMKTTPGGTLTPTSVATEYDDTFELQVVEFQFSFDTRWDGPFTYAEMQAQLTDMRVTGRQTWSGTGRYVFDVNLGYMRSLTLEGDVSVTTRLRGMVVDTDVEFDVLTVYSGESKFTLATSP